MAPPDADVLSVDDAVFVVVASVVLVSPTVMSGAMSA